MDTFKERIKIDKKKFNYVLIGAKESNKYSFKFSPLLMARAVS